VYPTATSVCVLGLSAMRKCTESKRTKAHAGQFEQAGLREEAVEQTDSEEHVPSAGQ
jgi:hypothetical protein